MVPIGRGRVVTIRPARLPLPLLGGQDYQILVTFIVVGKW